jgi:transcription initiation factor TFIID subunit 13
MNDRDSLSGLKNALDKNDGESTVTPRISKRQKTKSNMFEDIEEMMFGFGDSWPSNPESVELMEKIVVNYIRNLCVRALEISDLAGMKLDKECFMYLVRKDRRKFNRACSLVKANEELKRVQKYEMTEEDA